MLANKKFSFHRPTISSGNVLSYQDPVTISLTTALNNATQANVVTFTLDTNLTTEPKLFYEITGNVSASDFTDSVPLYGSVTLDANGNATITKNVQSLGYANVDFVLNLRTGHPQTQIRATSNTVEYIDVPTVTATGGTETSNVDSFYKIHEFTATGNLIVSDLGDTANFSLLTDTQSLVVGGGGGGGQGGAYIGGSSGAVGGGGSGGNVITGNSNITVSTFSATIGSGGSGSNGSNQGTDGGDTVFALGNLTAEGGSLGGGLVGSSNAFEQGNADVTGGGSGIVVLSNEGFRVVTGGNGSITDGGSSFTSASGSQTVPFAAGGGGGATGDGASAGGGGGGTGGTGVTSSITGTSLGYGGGGGGAGGLEVDNPISINGGSGTDGGGNGARFEGSDEPTAGTRGGGGGGGGPSGGTTAERYGADGGSGVVIVRYIEHYRKANIL